MFDPGGEEHRLQLATLLGDLSCNEDGGPYVARAMVRLRLAALGEQLDRVRDRMKAARKNPETCPGVAGFTEDDWRVLEAIRPAHP